MKKKVSFILLSFLFAGILNAKELDDKVETVVDSTRIMFHQSKSDIDSAYNENKLKLEEMLSKMKVMQNHDSIWQLRQINVIGAASPEGSTIINEELSKERADRIFGYFSKRIALQDSLTNFHYIGRDWQGLRKLVGEDESVPYKSDVISLLDNIIEHKSQYGDAGYSNINKLKTLRNGVPYRYMYSNLFPQLRTSRLFVEYELLPDLSEPEIIPEPEDPDSLIVEDVYIVKNPLPEIIERKMCKPFYMDVKTNMLYDLLALPNIGVEFYLGKNWSLSGNWMYGWWDKDSRHRYWRAYGGDITLRRWFGSKAKEKPLTGHHLGVYAGVVTYDFEFGGTGIMGGLPNRTLWDRCNFVAGVEYGYSLPIAKRLNLDFTLGIGYLGGKYIKYKPMDGEYVWESTNKIKWFGPTKVEISLVWLIGCDNYNRK